MVEGKYNKYLVESAQRIDVRYWLIQVHGKYYVIDYSNPRDIRNYFPIIFPKLNTEWKIYDVTKDKDTIPFLKTKLFGTDREKNKKVYNWTLFGSILYILNIKLFPKFLNIHYLTYDPRIRQNWQLILGLMLLSLIVTVVILMSLRQVKLPIDKDKALILKQINVKEMELAQKHKLKWYVRWTQALPGPLKWGLTLIFIVGSLLLGVATSSYSQLLFFGIIPWYVFFESKFLGFIPISEGPKYQIIEKEEK
jgi:ABC-2 type transport system permease protein